MPDKLACHKLPSGAQKRVREAVDHINILANRYYCPEEVSQRSITLGRPKETYTIVSVDLY